MAPPFFANEPVAAVNVIALPQSRLRMQDFGGFPLVLMPIEYCLRTLLEAECSEAQIETQVVIEMTSPDGILQAWRKGRDARFYLNCTSN